MVRHGSGQPLTCCLHGDPHPTLHPLGTHSSCAGHQQRQRWGQPPKRGQSMSWCAGRPRARCTEGTESVPRQCTRGHQLLPGLKGRAAAWGTQHPATGKCRGMSLCLDSAVSAARAQHRMAEPEKLQRRSFLYSCSRGLADWSLKHKRLLSPAFCRSEVNAHPSDASLPPQKQGDLAGS